MAENMFTDLAKVIDQVGRDKGIDKEIVIDANSLMDVENVVRV